MPKVSHRPIPEVILTGDLSQDSHRTWTAIQAANRLQLFLSASEIVWVHGKPAKLMHVNERVLRRFATDNIRFRKWNNARRSGDGAPTLIPAEPKDKIFQNMLAGPLPELPRLRGVVHVPVFTHKGLITERGYSASAELYYDPDPGLEIFEVSNQPTREEIELAKTLLDELLGDFPFVDEPSKTHAVGALILPFVRPLIAGPTPLHVIEKPTPRTGASKLARTLANISCKPHLIHPPEEEAEQERALFAVLREGPVAIILDNVTHLSGNALASMLTEVDIQHRIIGSSCIGKAENQALWLAAANNPRLSTEITGRSAPIRLDAKMERPQERTGFKHPDLEAWAREDRSLLIWAALTIVQYWFQAGRPRSRKSLGGFESWAETIGGILDRAGIDGFLENLESFRSRSDTEAQAWSQAVQGWANRFGSKEVTAGELREIACAAGIDLGWRDQKSQDTRLGRLLAQRQDQCFGRWRITKRAALLNGRQYWSLQKID